MEGCLSKTAKIFLTGFGFLFLAFGLAVAGFGIFIFFETSKYLAFLPIDYTIAAYCIIALGGVIVFITALGLIGTFTGNRYLIGFFVTSLIIILLIEISGGVTSSLLQTEIQARVKTQMHEAMGEYNETVLEWDNVQLEHRCCGVNEPEDWEKKELCIPESCCITNNDDMEDCNEIANNTFTIGCAHVLIEHFIPVINVIPSTGDHADDMTIVTGLVVAIACFELFGILFGFCFCNFGTGKQDDNDDVSDEKSEKSENSENSENTDITDI